MINGQKTLKNAYIFEFFNTESGNLSK